jgi:hypothetical protein
LNRWYLGFGIILAVLLVAMNAMGFSLYHWAVPGRSAEHGTPGGPGHSMIWHK